MLESDLLYSSILNCPNNIAGIPNPCTQVALILPNARGLKKYNDDYPIMQDLCVSGVFSDKGFPIICTKKENTLKIQSPKPSNKNAESKEVLESNVDFSIPTLSIITAYDGLDEFYFTPSIYESRKSNESKISSQANVYNTNKSLDISFDSISNDDFPNDLANNNTLESVLESLTHIYDKKHFSYRIFSIRVAYSMYEYMLIIPKKIPKFIYKMLKEKRKGDEIKYGYGRFMDLQRDYVRDIDESKENEVRLNIQGKILLAPSGMERIKMVVR